MEKPPGRSEPGDCSHGSHKACCLQPRPGHRQHLPSLQIHGLCLLSPPAPSFLRRARGATTWFFITLGGSSRHTLTISGHSVNKGGKCHLPLVSAMASRHILQSTQPYSGSVQTPGDRAQVLFLQLGKLKSEVKGGPNHTFLSLVLHIPSVC